MGRSCFEIMVIYFLLSLVFLAEHGRGDECPELRCRDNGPAIRFPFRLRDRQADDCGYPGFDVSCTDTNDTLLELPYSVKLFVKRIDYKSQAIHVYDNPNGCLPKKFQNLSLSASPFQYFYTQDYAILNCSSRDKYSERWNRDRDMSCCDVDAGYQVCAIFSNWYNIDDFYLSNCTKMYNISSVPPPIFEQRHDLRLTWFTPVCRDCEVKGKRCGFKHKNINGSQPETECSIIPINPPTDASKKIVITGAVVGPFLLVIVLSILYHVYRLNKIEKENQVKIENFLEDYKALKPARYSYADIKRITNQFKEKLGQGGYGTVFKGKLSDEVLVAVKMLNESKGNGEEFINEVGTMDRIHHVNVVRLVGFCADGFRRALVYEFSPNESLEKFIFSSDGKHRSLNWRKLQDIALGIAKGIEYLHQGCDQRILHLDIKPHNILLDHNFNPKITDFGMAKLCSKNQSAVSMTLARGTMGYIAPEVLSRNFGHVSYKSDVYSFGMLLLEMVGGRKNNVITAENTTQSYFPEWIYTHFDQGKELQIRIEEEGDAEIAKRLAIVGLWCIQWCPIDRPPMKEVVQMLEAEGDNLTMPPNPFASTAGPARTNAKNPRKPLHQELEVISEISECTS